MVKFTVKNPNHVLSRDCFWKFNRCDLRRVLFDLCFFQDPDEVEKSTIENPLSDLWKAKLVKNNQNIMDWSNIIYNESLDFIPKSKFISTNKYDLSISERLDLKITSGNSNLIGGSGIYCFAYLSNNAPFYNFVRDHNNSKYSGCLKYTDGEWRLERIGKLRYRKKTICKFHHIWWSTH